MSNAQPVIRTRQLVKHYHDGERTLEVLRGVNFDLAAGETVAIVGQSGSGKSTLLNLLCLLDRPTAGRMEFEGEVVFDVAGGRVVESSPGDINRMRRDRVGLVFQFHHLLQEFRAWENVAMPALIGGATRGEAKRRALEILEQVGLGDRANHLPTKMSGGEQQRVALARALMNQPAVVLADEPTGNLDVETGRQVADLLWKATQGQGKSLVIVTHEVTIASRADRILRLDKGTLHPVKKEDWK